MSKIVIYEWKAWGGFLLNRILPNAVRVEAHWTQSTRKVLSNIPKDTEFFIFHINLTKSHAVPKNRSELVEKLESRGIRVLNSTITDISKSYLHSCLEELGLPSAKADLKFLKDDDFVIVKSDFNCGGGMERKLKDKDKKILGITEHHKLIPATRDYRVCKIVDVEDKFWSDPMFNIEKFISNKKDRIWRVYIFGNHVSLSEVIIKGKIKKIASNMPRVSHNFIFDKESTYEASFGEADINKMKTYLYKLVRHLNIDFCTVDVAESEVGEFYIIDFNTTPFFGVLEPVEKYWGVKEETELLEHLRSNSTLTGHK